MNAPVWIAETGGAGTAVAPCVLPLLAGLRVLIVEDETLIAYVLDATLSEAGAIIIGVAGSLPRAIALLAQAAPDAVTLDCNLLGQSTGILACALRARHIPTLVVTGYTDRVLADPDLSLLPRLIKPFTSEELLAAASRYFLPKTRPAA